MANCVLNRTFKHSQLKNAHRLLIIALADRCNPDGICDPGFGDIAERVNVTDRQAKRLVAQAETTGEIYIGHGGGRHSTNLYFVTVGLPLDVIEATLEKYFNLGDKTAETALAIFEQIKDAGLYEEKPKRNGDTQGRNGVTDDTVSRSQKGDTQGQSDDLKGVIDDTVYAKDDGNGVIQGQETVSQMTPEPSSNLLNQPIKPLEVEQQPQLSHASPAAAAVDPNDDHPDFPDDPKRDQQNQVIDLYRLSFLNPTQFIPPKMLEVLRKDALKYPLPWIERAVEKSITGGKDWRYVQGILKNWLAVGGPENDQKPGGQNGHQNGAGNDTRGNSNRKQETPSQAAQWEAENGERFRAAVARLTRC